MDISQILSLVGAIGAGGIITAVIAAIRDRHKDRATAAKEQAAAAKTMAEREEILSRIGFAQIEEARKSANKAWEMAERIEEELKEAKEDIRSLRQELNEERAKRIEGDKEVQKLKLQLTKFQPQQHGRSPRTPEG